MHPPLAFLLEKPSVPAEFPHLLDHFQFTKRVKASDMCCWRAAVDLRLADLWSVTAADNCPAARACCQLSCVHGDYGCGCGHVALWLVEPVPLPADHEDL